MPREARQGFAPWLALAVESVSHPGKVSTLQRSEEDKIGLEEQCGSSLVSECGVRSWLRWHGEVGATHRVMPLFECKVHFGAVTSSVCDDLR